VKATGCENVSYIVSLAHDKVTYNNPTNFLKKRMYSKNKKKKKRPNPCSAAAAAAAMQQCVPHLSSFPYPDAPRTAATTSSPNHPKREETLLRKAVMTS
jgi:hypothetical protein